MLSVYAGRAKSAEGAVKKIGGDNVRDSIRGVRVHGLSITKRIMPDPWLLDD